MKSLWADWALGWLEVCLLRRTENAPLISLGPAFGLVRLQVLKELLRGSFIAVGRSDLIDCPR